jgi:alkylation response protein AidB-like acyl-CoA dehydrogenase
LISSPADPVLAELCAALRERAESLEAERAWPAEQLALCARHGVFTWFVPREHGGQGWSEADIVRGYLVLSAACLTTTFVITQFMGAVTRIVASGNAGLHTRWLDDLLSGRRFATVGISHLTTSRRHLAVPVLRAEETAGGFVPMGGRFWPPCPPTCRAFLSRLRPG